MSTPEQTALPMELPPHPATVEELAELYRETTPDEWRRLLQNLEFLSAVGVSIAAARVAAQKVIGRTLFASQPNKNENTD